MTDDLATQLQAFKDRHRVLPPVEHDVLCMNYGKGCGRNVTFKVETRAGCKPPPKLCCVCKMKQSGAVNGVLPNHGDDND
jgi:hypothetical protein